MESKKFSSSKYKTNELLVILIRLSFFGIGLGIISGSLIKGFKNTESTIKKDSSLIQNRSIVKNSIEEVNKEKSSIKSSIELPPKFNSKSLNNEVVEANKINANTDNLIFSYPLKATNPTKFQLKALIEAWLEGKATILAGGESELLSRVARKNLVNIVRLQRTRDKELKEFQVIKATIKSLIIKEKTIKRIELSTKISYEDQRLKISGETIEKTNPSTLKINYILGRKDNQWMLIDFFMVD